MDGRKMQGKQGHSSGARQSWVQILPLSGRIARDKPCPTLSLCPPLGNGASNSLLMGLRGDGARGIPSTQHITAAQEKSASHPSLLFMQLNLGPIANRKEAEPKETRL